MTATISMISPLTWGGSKKRFEASTKSQPVIIQIEETDTRVPTISARCQPKVKLFVADFCAIVNARIEMPKPSISLARCAESVKMAIEPAIYPPMSCAVMKKTDTIETVMSFFLAATLLSFCIYRRCSKFNGDFTGIGVPNTSSWRLSDGPLLWPLRSL